MESLPIPVCAIMLAIVSLGNLLRAVCSNLLDLGGLGYLLQTFCGIVTLILLILMLLKFIFCFKMVVKMVENPEMAALFSAYTLTLMVFAGYLPPYTGTFVAEVLWWFGVLMHYTNMVLFTYKFVIVDFKMPALLPPWYIVYVGFALSGFSAKDFAPHWFGIAAFIVGFICFWILFFIFLIKYRNHQIPRMDEPTLCINAALGICLTTYVRSFTHPWVIMIFFLYFSCLFIWIWILFHLPKWLKLPFYPTDSAFSFPFVVSAIASLEAQQALSQMGFYISAWNTPIVLLQTLVAVVMVSLTVYRFIKAIAHSLRIKNKTERSRALNMMNMARDRDGKINNEISE